MACTKFIIHVYLFFRCKTLLMFFITHLAPNIMIGRTSASGVILKPNILRENIALDDQNPPCSNNDGSRMGEESDDVAVINITTKYMIQLHLNNVYGQVTLQLHSLIS